MDIDVQEYAIILDADAATPWTLTSYSRQGGVSIQLGSNDRGHAATASIIVEGSNDASTIFFEKTGTTISSVAIATDVAADCFVAGADLLTGYAGASANSIVCVITPVPAYLRVRVHHISGGSMVAGEQTVLRVLVRS
jgi:hypothetical protein